MKGNHILVGTPVCTELHLTLLHTTAGHADEEEEDEEDQELDLDDPDLLNDGEEGDSDENLEDADDLDAEDDPDQDQGDPDDDGMGIFRQALHQSSHPAAAAASAAGGLVDEGAAADVDRTAGMSKHERQQLRMQERIAKLEAQNMAEKEWFMQGEAGAGQVTSDQAAQLSDTHHVVLGCCKQCLHSKPCWHGSWVLYLVHDWPWHLYTAAGFSCKILSTASCCNALYVKQSYDGLNQVCLCFFLVIWMLLNCTPVLLCSAVLLQIGTGSVPVYIVKPSSVLACACCSHS